MTTTRVAVNPRTSVFALRLALGLVGSAAFGLLIGGLIAAWVAIQFFGYKVVTVQSFSMEPALHRGDLIVSRPIGINDVHDGQVILFEEGTKQQLLVAHRVQSITNVTTNITNSKTGEVTTEHSRLLRTQGDANATPDADPVDASRLRGKMWFSVPRVGLVLDRVPLQAVLLMVAAASGVAWIAYELLRRRGRQPGAGSA
jgi:signal peptidase I